MVFSCGGSGSKTISFGEQVDTTIAIPVELLANKIKGNFDSNVTIKGLVKDVCRAEGCWLKLERKGQEPLMVKFKSDSMNVNESIVGKYAFVKGTATDTSFATTSYILDEDTMTVVRDTTITYNGYQMTFIAMGVLVR